MNQFVYNTNNKPSATYVSTVNHDMNTSSLFAHAPPSIINTHGLILPSLSHISSPQQLSSQPTLQPLNPTIGSLKRRNKASYMSNKRRKKNLSKKRVGAVINNNTYYYYNNIREQHNIMPAHYANIWNNTQNMNENQLYNHLKVKLINNQMRDFCKYRNLKVAVVKQDNLIKILVKDHLKHRI